MILVLTHHFLTSKLGMLTGTFLYSQSGRKRGLTDSQSGRKRGLTVWFDILMSQITSDSVEKARVDSRVGPPETSHKQQTPLTRGAVPESGCKSLETT
ncbi:hypothetical protein RRG08_036057 [Elysia crispata]|uniref:Uncharacterized protein n=1 Tax=Elysia crispata TaxID=231223 RepID=A0AAE1E0H6_9GAST|nr:hypothetical protein RRG08_036057 [Elysia crispata]